MESSVAREQSIGSVKQRPPLFRALGAAEPPDTVRVDGVVYRLENVLKHDSWAATAIYHDSERRIICKFNRKQPILGIPAGIIGRWLAAREGGFLRRMKASSQVPSVLGPVEADGRVLPNACARRYIDGHPLGRYEAVGDEFFSSLRGLVGELHHAGIAHVDLHKRENILVGDDGRPYLIDFQVCAAIPWALHRRMPWLRHLLTPLFRMDRYHVAKHHQRLRPDQCGLSRQDVARQRPFWVRVHRWFAEPLRELRRLFLVKLGIRRGNGHAHSELFPEDAIRREATAIQ